MFKYLWNGKLHLRVFYIFFSFGKNKNLTHLNLSDNELFDEGAINLAQGI